MWLPPWIQWSTLEPVIEPPPAPVPEVMPDLEPLEEIAPEPDAYSEPTPEIELEQTLPAPTIETIEPEAIMELEHEPYLFSEIELTLLAPTTDITPGVAPIPALHLGSEIVP